MIEEIKSRLAVGYTVSVYGTRALVHEQMEDDLNSLVTLFEAKNNDWRFVYETAPPEGQDVLARSPEGVVYLCSWRPAYDIFTVQGKKERSYDWEWKLID